MTPLRILDAKFEGETMLVELSDGRVLRVDLQSLPALRNATIAARSYYQRIADGQALAWPSIGQAITLADMLRDVES